ncbi:MAG: PAS domain S-box protein [Elainellaceae cyanobacterium]
MMPVLRRLDLISFLRGRVSLWVLLVVPFALQTLAIVGLISYLSYRSGKKSVENLANQFIDANTQRVSEHLDHFLGDAQHLVTFNRQAFESGRIDLNNFSEIEDYFFETLSLQDHFSSVGVGTAQGESLFVGVDKYGVMSSAGSVIVAETTNQNPRKNYAYLLDEKGTRTELIQTVSDYDPREIIWYQTALENGQAWTPIYSVVLAPVASSLAVAPIRGEQGTSEGVIFVNVSLQDISQFLSTLNLSEHGQTFIIERSGDLVATSTKDEVYTVDEAKDPPQLIRRKATDLTHDLIQATTQSLLKQGEGLQTIDYLNFSFVDRVSLENADQSEDGDTASQRQRYYAEALSYQDGYGIDWLIVTVIPASDFMGGIHSNVRRTVELSVLALLGTLGIGVLTSRRIARVVKRLSESTKKLAKGNFEQPIAPSSITELETLSQSFRKMVDSLRQAEHLRHNYEQALEQQVTERTIALNEVQRIAKIGNWSWDLVNDERWWSPQMYKIAGLDPEQYAAPPDVEIANQNIHPDDRQRVNQVIQAAIEQCQSYEIEFRFLRPDGSVVYAFSKGQVECKGAGNAVHFWGFTQDITERKQAELDLTQSKNRLRLITDSIPACISYIDASQRYRFVNRTYELWFGYRKKDLLGRTVEDVIGTEAYRLTKHHIDRVLSGEAVAYEAEIPYQEGKTRYVSGVLVPEIDAQSQVQGYYALITDISDRKQAECELQQAKETAEDANAAKGSFIANMSHELRSPLNAILGFANLLQLDSAVPPAQRENAAIIERSGEHLLGIINQLLDMARLEANRMSLNIAQVDLWSLLSDIYSLFSLRAKEKGLDFRIERSPTVPHAIDADNLKLRQVLINLLDNAIKFTQQGHVTLSVEAHPIKAKGTEALPSQIQINFRVNDTGYGISPDDQTMLFEAFSQTESGRHSHQGSGLGLAISREYARLMGGEMTVESAVGQGSCFRFHIQTHAHGANHGQRGDRPPNTISPSATPLARSQPDQPRHRVLIVDDNPANRLLLVQLLSRLDLDLQEAENGEMAVQQWKSWQPQMIFMDLRMPILDGYGATRQIRTLEQSLDPSTSSSPTRTAIVAVSATGLEHPHCPVADAGCDALIRKPFDNTEIFRALEYHLQRPYRYTDADTHGSSSSSQTTTQSAPGTISQLGEALRDLDSALVSELEEAIILGDKNLIEQALKKVAIAQPDLAQALNRCIEQFCHVSVLEEIEKSRQ